MAKTAKRTAVAAPQSIEELNEYIRELGELQRQQDELNIALTREVDELTAKTTPLLQPLVDRAEVVFDGIMAYTSAHRDELTEGDKIKTIKLPAGDCNWRNSPPAVKLVGKIKVLIERIKKMGMQRFIRTKEEIDKKMMLKEPELAQSIAGVKIKQDEIFTVKPNAVQAEITRDSIKKSRPKRSKKT